MRPRPRAGWALLLLLLLASGCLHSAPAPAGTATSGPSSGPASVGPTEAPASIRPDSCENQRLPASGNAPLLAAFQGDPAEVAQRAGRALGDPGNVSATRLETGGFALIYESRDRMWPGPDESSASAEIRRFYADLGVPASVALDIAYLPPSFAGELKPRATQPFAGGSLPVLGVDAARSVLGNRTYGVVGPLYDLSRATADLTLDEAVAAATAHLGCSGLATAADLRLAGTSSFGVAAGSLAWSLELVEGREGHHCGGDRFEVQVDTATGRVHHVRALPCI